MNKLINYRAFEALNARSCHVRVRLFVWSYPTNKFGKLCMIYNSFVCVKIKCILSSIARFVITLSHHMWWFVLICVIYIYVLLYVYMLPHSNDVLAVACSFYINEHEVCSIYSLHLFYISNHCVRYHTINSMAVTVKFRYHVCTYIIQC